MEAAGTFVPIFVSYTAQSQKTLIQKFAVGTSNLTYLQKFCQYSLFPSNTKRMHDVGNWTRASLCFHCH
jgi:hypothetical protein